MVGLDSNVLVRYFAQDDPVQSPQTTDLIERRLSVDNPGFISVIVLAETAWVLERVYRFSGLGIAAALEPLLQVDVFVVQSPQEVFVALAAARRGQGAFADALIGALALRAGCSSTLTFDRKALRLPGFAPIG